MSSSEPSRETHLHYLQQALSLARLSPPKPTNFRVGCVIVSFTDASPAAPSGRVLSTGYTLEEDGNTHAEQNALAKLAREHGIAVAPPPADLEHAEVLGSRVLTSTTHAYLYTSLEPCGLRLSGATPCAERIIATRRGGGGIRKVVFGAREPGTFVQDSKALKMLDDAAVPWEYVTGLEDEILRVAKEGHVTPADDKSDSQRDSKARGTNVDDISPEERRRQEQQPRNPKKRMMEVDLSR